jgi:ribonuclease-3
MTRLDKLSKALDVEFGDPVLLRTALTHRSAKGLHNERLEFLGDAVLNCAIAETLYRRFPDAREGELTRLRSTLVRGETLARLARGLELGDYLIMGSGELKSGGYRRDSVLEDAIEAIIGAVFEDQGVDSARRLIRRLFEHELAAIEPGEKLKDPKSRLQEYQQGRKLALPAYTLVSASGPDHQRHYRVTCAVAGLSGKFHGDGISRRHAEQMAAAAALATLLNATND